MEEYNFEKIDEKLYKYTLDNGIDVYMYPFEQTKNFYCTISVKYGSRVTKYKKNNKVYDVIPGSAHFLEHRIMILGEDNVLSQRLNELGSIANAWTSNYATNYNIYGSTDINKNIELLLDIFHNPKFIDEDIDEEKLIIGEEIDMNKDKIQRYLYDKLYKNLFNNSYVRNTVVGEKEDIAKINAKYLTRIYNHIYTPNNTFIVITGNFNKEDVLKHLIEYYKKNPLKQSSLYKRVIDKEKEEVNINYEEVSFPTEIPRVRYAFKMKKDIFNIKDDNILSGYLNIILNANFGVTSKLFERYKKEEIITTMGYIFSIVDNYVVIGVSAVTKNPKEFIDNISKDINNLTITKNDIERAKKKYIKEHILTFESIEDVEYKIVDDITRKKKVIFDDYSIINSFSYSKCKNILNKIDTKNYSIIKTIKE